MKDVYENCPVYETDSFVFRLVTMEDAEALLVCYSNCENVVRFNSDFCTNNFYYTTLEQMQDCIRFWLNEYEKHYYVRFAVVFKKSKCVIGTIEIFGGEAGVLRIDLPVEYECKKHITEMLKLAINCFAEDFGIDSIKIKTVNTPERIPWLEEMGFTVANEYRPGLGYHEYNLSERK